MKSADVFFPSVVDYAHQIIDMHDELTFLRGEVMRLREYEQKYHDEVQRSIAHSKSMIGGILGIVTKPGVMEAIAADNERK